MTGNRKYSDFRDMLRKQGLSSFDRICIDENMKTFYNIYRYKNKDIILEIKNPELFDHKFSWIVIIGLNQFTDNSGSKFLDPYKIKINNDNLNIELIQKWSKDSSEIVAIPFMKSNDCYILETGIHLVKFHDTDETLRLRISGHNIENIELSDIEFYIEVDFLMFYKTSILGTIL